MTNTEHRLRYAVVGAGHRAEMYLDAIAGDYRDHAELVAWTDTNPGRLDFYAARYDRTAAHRGFDAVARFAPDALAAAVDEHDVDRVIVTSPDATHAGYVVTALDAGADVIVEKPLAIDGAGIAAIAAAVARNGRDDDSVVVTFNYRYAPRNAALRRVIADGEIGEVTSVHFEWLLDTSHGADYFRRWHRDKAISGGLAVHKSTHHFDLVNWWLDDAPARVVASGGLHFYGAANAARRGLGPRPARGSIDSPQRDAFSLDLRDDEWLKGLYLDQEHHDGYLRDRDVFDEGITIEDNLSVLVDYAGGASMAYTLCAHAPWEGYNVTVNGTAGRVELSVVERGAVLLDDDGRVPIDPSAVPGPVAADADRTRPGGERLVVQRQFEPAREVEIPAGTGGHGGGDARMLRDIFTGGRSRRTAGAGNGAPTWRDGVRSVAVGIAVNESLQTGGPVAIDLADRLGATAP